MPSDTSTSRTDQSVEELRRELAAAREQQVATSELLKVIGRSTFDLQLVFDALADSAVRLCEAERSLIYRLDGDRLRVAASHNATAEVLAFLGRNPMPQARASAAGRASVERRTIHIEDVLADPEYTYGATQVDPVRTVLAIPMLRGEELLGVIVIYRHEVRPFTTSQIALMETFADQAVIAIENTRLFEAEQASKRELQEALERQTATSDVLSVISSSPGKLAPVFKAMLANAVRICNAKFGFMNLYDYVGDTWKIAAVHGAAPAYTEYLQQHGYKRPGPETVVARIARTKQMVHIADLAASRGYVERDAVVVAAVERGGVRTLLGVPMLKKDELIGAILLYHQEVCPFTEKQIELVTNFASQAVIAIENTRLFDEVQARTNELQEALEQQTATSGVLRAISKSPTDVQPVFDTIVRNAVNRTDFLGGCFV